MDRRSVLKKTGLVAGATVAMPTLLSLLQSCWNEPRLTWKPEFFTKEEATTIGTLVEMILPRTDTPGALDVKVDVFIDRVISQTYDQEGQQNIRNEITTFNNRCKEKFGTNFASLDVSERVEVLKAEEKSTGKFNPGIWGITIGDQEPIGFYRSMKSMAIWAYFTSEVIGEQVLSYDPIPGSYEPCKPLSEVGNRWSL
ncbi:gluconate 2-dehydrogenase subunit 3 family protein [Arenibacter sp. F26102]|uniref:gluconate 2-dehydrogenase subunit 3 family protein n=1 Tax=Arenibacter sp. F26102 TaxID=2926416 RepID=UPI001FF152EB|nr:gluconate 2-dehydrogenase subunit 3 family protein [Arenibacter sp. F26102]MCK0148184.1 gluconate 2-dehydrogenase subunit 3 family protein [Arenibacter sp. F26102]